MKRDFKADLARILSERGITASQYSRLIGHATSGLVYNVLLGKKPLPLDELDAWLGALDIRPATPEYRRLRMMAFDAYAPPWALLLIQQMRTETRTYMHVIAEKLREAGVEPPPIPESFGGPDDDQAARPPRRSTPPVRQARR